MGQAIKTDRYPVVEPTKMADGIMQFSPATDAEALKLLRARFPDCPLSQRIIALNMLMLRQPLGVTRH